MGFFWGVDQEYVDGGPFEKTFFDDVRKKNWPKTGEIFTVCSWFPIAIDRAWST